MAEQKIAAVCCGVRVPASPFLNETRIERINAARYEGDEIAGALAVIGPDDRVLEMGAGLGVVGGVIAHNARPAALLSFEANPAMIPHIRALHAANHLGGRIALRNEVVISAPERPETATFFVRNSFLGSSLIDHDHRDTRAVEVPTRGWSDVLAEFRPTVLVMDIEGGELEFLRHADLSGIRAVVIEFHPGIYGRAGTRECKSILRAGGFSKLPGPSTRLVWACTREITAEPDPPGPGRAESRFLPPDPEGGWSGTLERVERARVIPPVASGHVQVAGVLRADRSYCENAGTWRNERAITLRPLMPEGPIARLEGRWLWGGILWTYFAHFVGESTARLWALDAVDLGMIAGIAFMPKRPRLGDTTQPFQRAFLDLMDTRLPIHVCAVPTEIEELVVPGQGFGLGAISRGTQATRATFRARFGRGVTADGPERLYISRSELGAKRGALIGEPELEAYLIEQGYEIFHPQNHPLEVQVARYKAARQIIGAEGSAMHVLAFAARPHQQIALIVRRRSRATTHIATHLEHFAGRAPDVIETLVHTWLPKGQHRRRLGVGELDLPALQARLIAGGFIGAGPPWAALSAQAVEQTLGGRYDLIA